MYSKFRVLSCSLAHASQFSWTTHPDIRPVYGEGPQVVQRCLRPSTLSTLFARKERVGGGVSGREGGRGQAAVVQGQGQFVEAKTFSTISRPVTTCQRKRLMLTRFNVMCTYRAVSLPFCMAGTQPAATAHVGTITAATNKWGPGKSLPART